MKQLARCLTALGVLLVSAVAVAQTPPAGAGEQLLQSAEQAIDTARDAAGRITQRLDQSDEVKRVSAGILEPIYQVAEFFAFSWFHWLAFMLTMSGVVNFGLQLVLGKLVVLSRLSFSPLEIVSDVAAFLTALIGLVLVTQAAAENSTFTTSSGAVLSATVVGVVLGVVFYMRGQAHELLAARMAAKAKRD